MINDRWLFNDGNLSHFQTSFCELGTKFAARCRIVADVVKGANDTVSHLRRLNLCGKADFNTRGRCTQLDDVAR